MGNRPPEAENERDGKGKGTAGRLQPSHELPLNFLLVSAALAGLKMCSACVPQAAIAYVARQ